MNKKDKIGIITRPLVNASITPISNLTEILCTIYGHVYLITSCKGLDITIKRKNLEIIDLDYDINVNPIFKVFKYLFMQFHIAWLMLKFRNVNTWIFFIESHTLILPVIISKIISNNTLILVGSCLKHTWIANKNLIIYFSTILENISYRITDKIILYSPNLIKFWDLEKYNKKIIIAHRHFLDFNRFKITKKFDEKENLVGYIGRLSHEKGIMNLLSAINMLPKTEDNLKFLIIGDGYYKDELKKFIKINGLANNVNYLGWISHEELPIYLNKMKLLVIPSFTEGLPNVMLESMACGTPILASPVGSIPDIIKDGKNGFIMKDNSPENIAKDILAIINNKNLDKISLEANKKIENSFNKKNAIKTWEKIIDS